MQRLSLLLLTSSLLLLLPNFRPIATARDSSAPSTSTTTTTNYIRTSCGATLYPDVCYTSLSRYASAVQQSPARLARAAVGVSLSKARRMAAYISNLSRDGSDNPRVAAALHDCSSNFGDAVDEITGSLKQLRQARRSRVSAAGESFQFMMSNVQTWMSAALTDEDTCTDGFEDLPDGPVKADVFNRVENVRKYTSNALALVNSYAAKGAP